MARGRKPKHPDQQWLKNPPQHIVVARNTPEGQAKLQATKDLCKQSSNQWRQLRKMGVTIEYFEMQEITDPELMGKNALPWEDSKEKYASALIAIDDAGVRISAAQRKGADATRENAEALRCYIAEKFHDVVSKVQEKSWSVNHAAGVVINRLEALQAAGKYDEPIPEMTAAREHLKKLSEATP